MTESITSHVEPAAAIKRAENPHRPPERRCKICAAPAAAGSFWCRSCQGRS